MNEKQMWSGKPDNTRRDDAEKRPTNRADRRERRILIAFIAAARSVSAAEESAPIRSSQVPQEFMIMPTC